MLSEAPRPPNTILSQHPFKPQHLVDGLFSAQEVLWPAGTPCEPLQPPNPILVLKFQILWTLWAFTVKNCNFALSLSTRFTRSREHDQIPSMLQQSIVFCRPETLEPSGAIQEVSSILWASLDRGVILSFLSFHMKNLTSTDPR